ncbi:hypothetical protein [Prescottella equi]|uniref:hypothetical protein n=1 Tax=Rhodococcus hoagii TaxID=43767 RepID=UPI003850D9E7
MIQIATDRDGRQWALLATDSTLRARLVEGSATPAVMDLSDLVDAYGPLVLSPTRPATDGGFTAFVDTVDLVASDPGTACVEQIDQVARFAQSIVSATTARAHFATCSTPRASHVRASAIGGAPRDEMWGAEVGPECPGRGETRVTE